MLTRRPAEARGHADHGWLDSRFSFSFADYHDPRFMGFRALRVLNDDLIAPSTGFGLHGHRDMEIISWIIDGQLKHQDSLGSGGVLTPGIAQVMTAGTGIRHSEENPSADQRMRLLQLWIEPRRAHLKPAYHQREFPLATRRDRLCAVASGDGRDGSLVIQQDAVVFAALLASGKQINHALGVERHAWIQVARGALTVNGVALGAGDGLAVSHEATLTIVSTTTPTDSTDSTGSTDDSEFLLIDLP